MAIMTYSAYLQGEYEKWNKTIEDHVGTEAFEEMKGFILSRQIKTIEEAYEKIEEMGEAAERLKIDPDA